MKNQRRNGSEVYKSQTKALARGLGVAEHELFAVARGINTSRTLAHDRLTAIDENYQGLSRQDKHQVDYLIEILEREVDRLASIDITKRQSVPTAAATTTRVRTYSSQLEIK
jgi:hypothetical protein